MMNHFIPPRPKPLPNKLPPLPQGKLPPVVKPSGTHLRKLKREMDPDSFRAYIETIEKNALGR